MTLTKDDWQNKKFAEHWDKDLGSTFNVREEQLDILVSILVDGYQDGAYILDIGMGSGQVEELIFQRSPEARIVGIDSSQPMLDLAEKRLQPFKDRYTALKHDLRQLSSLKLPHAEFQFIITSQVLHEIPHENKKEVFALAHSVLAHDGTFLIADRTPLDHDYLSDSYKAIWSRWIRANPGSTHSSFNDFLENYETKKDFPATLEEHLIWLREAGFDAACLHLHLNRALIGAQPSNQSMNRR